MEEGLQRKFQTSKLDWQRLWRHPGKGPTAPTVADKAVDGKTYYHVYLTLSFEVKEALKKGGNIIDP